MVRRIENNKKYLPRLFWNNPITRFFDSERLDLWGNEMERIVPTISIKETATYYSIQVIAPGLLKEDFNVELEGNFLTISCEKEVKSDGSAGISGKEYSYTSFSRSITLPDDSDIDQVSAKTEDGLLVLRIFKITN